MRSFFASVPEARWARNTGLLHVYALPGPRVTAMATAYQQLLIDQRGVTGLSRQPPAHLHLTIELLRRHADQLTGEQLHDLLHALGQEVAAVPAHTLTVGPALVSAHSITLDVTPDRPWQALRAAVRTAAQRVLGPDVVAPMTRPGRPHITISYATGDVPIENHLSALNNLRLDRALLPVNEVALIAVDQDPDTGVYTWPDVLSRLPLAPPRSQARRPQRIR